MPARYFPGFVQGVRNCRTVLPCGCQWMIRCYPSAPPVPRSARPSVPNQSDSGPPRVAVFLTRAATELASSACHSGRFSACAYSTDVSPRRFGAAKERAQANSPIRSTSPRALQQWRCLKSTFAGRRTILLPDARFTTATLFKRFAQRSHVHRPRPQGCQALLPA
jgi:hypothetical protein